MQRSLRGTLIRVALVVASIGMATVLAVPDEPPTGDLTLEEIARIEDFVERFQQGQRLMGGGRDEDAEKVFRQLIEEEPEAAAVHHALGLLLQFRKRPDEAAAALMRAADLAPDDAAIQRDAGTELLRRGRPADAEPYLARAHKLQPDEVEILVTHATALRAIGRLHDAKAAYRDAIAADGNSVDARVGLAAAIVDQNPKRAIELVTGLPHAYIDVSLVHGLALMGLNRPEEALPHLVETTSNRPFGAAALSIFAQGTHALGRLGAARETAAASALWCGATADAPGLEPSLLLAQALISLDRPADALQVLGQARTDGAEPSVVRRARLVQGGALVAEGKLDEARAAFTVAADAKLASPERAIARRIVGRIEAAALATALGKKKQRHNDAAWSESLAATLAGDATAAADHMARARKLSDPPGEFPGLMLR